MEAFLLWFSGIAWGVKLFLALYAGLHFVVFIVACIFAARTAEDEDDLAAKKEGRPKNRQTVHIFRRPRGSFST